MTIQIKPPPLFPWQARVKREARRFNVVDVGRRSGKTTFGGLLAIEKPLLGGVCWWIAPTYSQGEFGWQVIKQLSQQIPGVKVREGDRQIIYPSKGIVQIKTGDNPDTLKGAGLDRAICDEAALLKQSVWTESIRPALSDKRGDAFFLSTPKGMGNWFFRLYGYGLDPLKVDWNSWKFPTQVANPNIGLDEIEAAKNDMPERLFLQEYMAEFIEDSGSVFRNVDAVSVGTPLEKARPGRRYGAAVDWGRSNDFTAISVWDIQARCEVYLDRFTDIGFSLQRGRIRALYERFNLEWIYAEKNSMGWPNVEALQDEGLPVVSFDTTTQSKPLIIEGLALACEKENIELINDDYAALEMKSYEMDRLPSGKYRYGAPDGMHDDCVMARAIALYGIESAASILVWSFGRQ